MSMVNSRLKGLIIQIHLADSKFLNVKIYKIVVNCTNFQTLFLKFMTFSLSAASLDHIIYTFFVELEHFCEH